MFWRSSSEFDCGFWFSAKCRSICIYCQLCAALGVQETTQVENIIRGLKEQEVPLILISHNLRQVFNLVDKIWVFRRGRIVGEVIASETDGNEIVSMITGMQGGVHEKASYI